MNIIQYFKDTRAELVHVTWPTREQAVGYTVLVVLIAIGTGVGLGLCDYVFSKLLTLFF